MTNPDAIPLVNTADPELLPPKASPSRLYAEAYAQILSLAASPIYGNDTCGQCLAGLEVAKFIALAAPQEVPALIVALCEHFKFSTTCNDTYGPFAYGKTITQVVANADAGGFDGQVGLLVDQKLINDLRSGNEQNLCQNFLSLCPHPPTSPLNLTGWFAKPKPNPLPPPKQPSGQRLKVLHISDFHFDASTF